MNKRPWLTVSLDDQDAELPEASQGTAAGYSPLSQGLRFSQTPAQQGAAGAADSPGSLADAAEKGLVGPGSACHSTASGSAQNESTPAAARLAALNISIAGLVPGLNIEV